MLGAASGDSVKLCNRESHLSQFRMLSGESNRTGKFNKVLNGSLTKRLLTNDNTATIILDCCSKNLGS